MSKYSWSVYANIATGPNDSINVIRNRGFDSKISFIFKPFTDKILTQWH